MTTHLEHKQWKNDTNPPMRILSVGRGRSLFDLTSSQGVKWIVAPIVDKHAT